MPTHALRVPALLSLAALAMAGCSNSDGDSATTQCWNPQDAAYSKTSTKGAGYEILDFTRVGPDFTGTINAWIDNDPNPIDEAAFATYSVPGWGTNTPRRAIFDYARTLGSPSAPPGPLTPYTDVYGYTWGRIAEVRNVMWPFNPADYPQVSPPPATGWEAAIKAGTPVPPGVVFYTANNKNQDLVFLARDPSSGAPIKRYFVTDEWGNVFIMKSANSANSTEALLDQAFDAAQLPPGWTKSTRLLERDLCVPPIYGGDNLAAFQEFRDSADSAYSQITWAANGNGVARLIGAPMPIWAGPRGSRVNGSDGDDTLYGGPGNDVFHPGLGNDTIDGGAGNNAVVLDQAQGAYTVTIDGDVTRLSGTGGQKALRRIQEIRYRDGIVRL
jgi:hypothetical protein